MSESSLWSVRTYHLCRKSLAGFVTLADALLAGFWLGVLDRNVLHKIDERYYSESPIYFDDRYNLRGLTSWETEAVARHFQACRRLLLIGAGGGREVIALSRMGYRVDGAECHPGLVAYANQLLVAQGFTSQIYLVPRDGLPDTDGLYDGIIVGWSAYMLIQGRQHRVAFLRRLRAKARPDAPLLLSFFARQGSERRYRIIAALGNTLRRLRRREQLQLGDALEPNYVHYFTKPELEAELAQGGFALCDYSTRSYGHAVARAQP